MPTHSSTPWKSTALVFLISFLLLLLSMDRAINIYDEGIVLTDAQLTLHGAVIHRDFHSVYGPGSYAFLAALFWLFGPSFIVARLFGLTVQALIVAAVFAILKVRTSAWVTMSFTAACLLWLIASANYLYPTYPCLLLTLIGSGLLMKSGVSKNGFTLFAAGCFCGLNAYFRYDAGFFVLAAQALAIMLVVTKERGTWWWRFQRGFRGVSWLAFGALVVFMPGFIAYAVTSPLSAFKADIIDYGLKIYPATRSLPFPEFQDVIIDPAQYGIYLAPIIVVLALPLTMRDYMVIGRAKAISDQNDCVPFSLLFSLLSIALYYKGFVRVSIPHMIFSIIPALALSAFLIDNCHMGRSWLRVAALVMSFVIFSTALIAATNQFRPFQREPQRYNLGWIEQHAGLLGPEAQLNDQCLPWSGMAYARLAPSYLRVARYINRNTSENDRILVGLDRHDKIFINALSLYFAADRLPGTHWSEYEPGIQNTSKVQQAMIEDLKHYDVRYVVRDSSYDVVREPNESAKSTGVRLLDDYIESQYRPIAKSGSVQVWLRNDVAPPTDESVSACRLDTMDASIVSNRGHSTQ